MADDMAPAPLTRTSVVMTSNGPVCGYVEDGLQVFKGLRYGAPSTGGCGGLKRCAPVDGAP